MNDKEDDDSGREWTESRAKRRRLVTPPDGFHKQTRVLRIPAQEFTSAFDHLPSRLPSSSNATRRDHPGDQPSERPESSSRTVRRLKPPMLVQPQAKPQAGQPKKRTTPISSYQPILGSSRECAAEWSPPPLRKLPPRLPPPLPSKTTLLKPLPPPVFESHTSTTKEMKTIFTTRVARATDPMTESGHAELLSILSHDQHRPPSSPVRELNRGILPSPEKAAKGKGPRFLRNGLAERASQILTKSHTAFTLWQKETENLSAVRRLTPDLRLLVTKVLHVSKPDRFRSPSVQRSRVALCRLLYAKHSSDMIKEETYILLLSSSSVASDTHVSVPEEVEADRELWVWQPWYQVDLSCNIPLEVNDSTNDKQPNLGNTSVALLCSRFLVDRT